MDNVRQWLDSLSLGQYANAFEAGDIDWEVLPELDHEVLKDLGVGSPGHRLRLLKAIRELGDAPIPPPATTEPASEVSASKPSVHPEAGGEAERRQLTVMFCDLVGSTALSEALDPEDLRELINAYQRSAAAAAERLGGHVARYMGDGVLVYFGYPRADEHDAARAVEAGLAVVGAVSSLQIPGGQRFQTRVGIATGLVVVGDLVESDIAKEHTVVGETPNLAARLQSLAGADEVVVSDVTRRLAREAFEFEDMGARTLKGFSEPVPVWRAIGERRHQDVAARDSDTRITLPLIGREREVGLLMNRWESSLEGDGQVVLLSGPAGMGKTRIVEAVLDALDVARHVAIRYFCSSHHVSSALHPVADQLTRAAGLVDHDPPESRWEKLDGLLRNPDFELPESLVRDVAPVLARLVGLDPADGAALDLQTAEQTKERTLDALVELLCAMSVKTPVVMMLEDAQWADATTRELFDAFVERTQDLPVLLVVTSRGDFEPTWTDFPHVTALTLNRLGSREVDALVQELCHGRALPDSVHERIVANTDGVPLFIEELTTGILESGLLSEHADRFELIGPLPPFAIPATLHDSLMARLDRLDSAKELAQTGAAIGRSFARQVIEAVTERPEAEIEQVLGRLEASGLLMRRGRGSDAQYTFRHALMQEVAYQSLLKSRRQVLHMRIAGVLADRFPEIAVHQPEVLARQYTEAGLHGAAAPLWLDAARRAKRLAAYTEAESHIASLLNVCDALADDVTTSTWRAQAQTLRGDVESLHGRLESANEAYEQALAAAPEEALAREVGNRLHRVHETASNGARIVYYVHGSGDETLLFVNPIAYGLALFQPVLERLCHEFRIVTMDCRGAGRSDPLVRPYSIEQHAEDTAAVIDDLGIGPVIGIGVSRGGNQLIRLAAVRPEVLKAVVLIGTPLRVTANTAIQEQSVHAKAQLSALERGDWDALFDAFARSIYTEPSVSHLAKQFAASCAALPRETMMSFFDGDLKLNIVDLLPPIDYPVLVAHGGDDQRVPVSMAHEFHELIPGSALHVFENKGHVPVFSAPEEFCEVLKGFVKTLHAPSAG